MVVHRAYEYEHLKLRLNFLTTMPERACGGEKLKLWKVYFGKMVGMERLKEV